MTDHRGYFNYRNETESGREKEMTIAEDDIFYIRAKTKCFGKSNVRFSSKSGSVDLEKVRKRICVLNGITD